MTEPPSPPLPPSGPPSGLNFSRWMEAQPLPPCPPYTWRVTWSTNVGIAIGDAPSRWSETCKGRPRCLGHPFGVSCSCLFRRGGLGWLGKTGRGIRGGRRHVDHPAAPPGPKLNMPSDQRKQGVIATAAHTIARVKVGAALPDNDFASIHQLTAKPLDPKPLSIGIPTVTRRGRALLVCHIVASALDIGDLDLGVLLAVSLALAVAGLVLELQNADLRTLALTKHLRGHQCRAEGGCI